MRPGPTQTGVGKVRGSRPYIYIKIKSYSRLRVNRFVGNYQLIGDKHLLGPLIMTCRSAENYLWCVGI